MSGGHFDYAHSRVQTFTEDLDQEIANNDVRDDQGYSRSYPPAVIEALKAVSAHAAISAKLMKAADWLYEGDTDSVTFLERFREIMTEAQ